jgi:NAD(P)-dependent dehydrogenase (short-subunit alcohol dehydrogenase family)
MPEAVTVITGAANGIARRLALDLLARGGRRLILCDLDEAGLGRSFGGTGATLRRLDVARLDDWRGLLNEVLAQHGRLDALCNIAGVIIPGWIYEVDPAAIDRTIDVNVKGVLYGSRLAAEQMVRQGSGHIVNMASLAGIAATPGNSLYCASKHAVRGFSLALAAELRGRGVAVSCVCPGLADTHMLEVQIDRPEAALSFTTGAPLTTEQVSALLQRVLERRPVEACLPSPALAKVSNAFPGLGMRLYRLVASQGLRAAARLRRRRTRR